MRPNDILRTDDLRDRLSELDDAREEFLAETCEAAGIDEDHDDYERLREETAAIWETQQPEGEEYVKTLNILEEVGNADYLVHEKYFVDHIREMLEDCGDVPRNMPWYIEIDWEATAKNIRSDYDEIEIDGQTYLYQV